MTPPRMTKEDVGEYYQDAHGGVWRLISYADQPTATLERLDPHDIATADGYRPARTSGVVGAPIFDGFRRLVPQDP